jgi:hypothetical protein
MYYSAGLFLPSHWRELENMRSYGKAKKKAAFACKWKKGEQQEQASDCPRRSHTNPLMHCSTTTNKATPFCAILQHQSKQAKTRGG